MSAEQFTPGQPRVELRSSGTTATRRCPGQQIEHPSRPELAVARHHDSRVHTVIFRTCPMPTLPAYWTPSNPGPAHRAKLDRGGVEGGDPDPMESARHDLERSHSARPEGRPRPATRRSVFSTPIGPPPGLLRSGAIRRRQRPDPVHFRGPSATSGLVSMPTSCTDAVRPAVGTG